VKQLITTATVLAILSTGYGQEENGDKRNKDSRKRPPSPEEFLKAYDQNDDQKISKEEFRTGERASRLDPEIREKIFNRLDKNGDSFISALELQEMAPKRKRHSLAKADLDEDGRISKEEFSKHEHFAEMPAERRDEIFDRIDRNGDGFLDQDSFKEFERVPFIANATEEEKQSAFTKFDSDGDQKISGIELRARFEKREKKLPSKN